MAEQLELFPDSRWSGESNQKRTQLSYLLQVPEQCVDERLVLDAWFEQSGEDAVAIIKQKLCNIIGCPPDELLRRLRDTKFRVMIGARVNHAAKKLANLSIRPEHIRINSVIA